MNAPGLPNDLTDLCVSLFARVREDCIGKPNNSPLVEPGTVRRCSLRDTGDLDKEAVSAMFISFPYLTASGSSFMTSPSDPDLHQIKTLLGSFYRYESTGLRDRSQALPKYFNNANARLIQVPQIWAVVLGSGTQCGSILSLNLAHECLRVPLDLLAAVYHRCNGGTDLQEGRNLFKQWPSPTQNHRHAPENAHYLPTS